MAAKMARGSSHPGYLVLNLREDSVHKVIGALDRVGRESSAPVRFLDDAEIVRDKPADLLLKIAELTRMRRFLEQCQGQIGAADHVEGPSPHSSRHALLLSAARRLRVPSSRFYTI